MQSKDNKWMTEVQFVSQGAYQVAVIDERLNREFFILLQFSSVGILMDTLCDCQEHEEHLTCWHVKLAMDKIKSKEGTPLHILFKHSFWNHFCRALFAKSGQDKERIDSQNERSYIMKSDSGKLLFKLAIMNQEKEAFFYSTLLQRAKETEENSLKFLNLSQDEIALWRSGRPSFDLSYELSFFCDLAKLSFMNQMQGAPYHVEFQYDKEGSIHGALLEFIDYTIFGYISRADIETLIPTLVTIESPLIVEGLDDRAIERIEYDEEKTQFLIIREGIQPRKKALFDKSLVYDHFGPWSYVPKIGFYKSDDEHLLSKDKIEQEDIPRFLELYAPLVKEWLSGYLFEKEPIVASYYLYFDHEDALNIETYLQERGDLQRSNSKWFNPYAFIEGTGFFEVQEFYFDAVKKIIKKEDLSSFITQNRIWLSFQEGFSLHLASILEELFYKMDPRKGLEFLSREKPLDKELGVKDFKDWLFVPSEGFYAKHYNSSSESIYPHLSIKLKDIPDFIYRHKESLEEVKGFFSSTFPLQEARLSLELSTQESLKISVLIQKNITHEKKEILILQDYTYVEAEGFCKIPKEYQKVLSYFPSKVIPKRQLDDFLAVEFSELIPYISYLDPKLQPAGGIEVSLDYFQKEPDGVWSMELSFKNSQGSLPFSEIIQAMNNKKRFLLSSIGAFDLSLSHFDWIRKLPQSAFHPSSKGLKLSSLEFFKIQSQTSFYEHLSESAKSKFLDISSHLPSYAYDTTYLKSNLRPYQEVGIKWLWFLYQENLSGLLSDDMGLGKTHQAMALMASAFQLKPESKFMVVCPTSVIYHWQEKLKKFLPDLKVYTLHGSSRDIESFASNYDILLTSYGVLRIELAFLSQLHFDIIVLDEAQIAKNHLSQTHKALLTLKAKMKLGLTGTPIENRLRELKALFDIILPGYMPMEDQFRDQFINPIEKFQDKRAKEHLSKVIKPFVLRRKKQEVLLELPEKVEEVVMAECLEEQRNLYLNALGSQRERLKEDLKVGQSAISFVTLFQLIGSLKQILDHPAVYYKNPEAYKEYQSGKWDLFKELIEKALESEQKVVVFSHYLDMLKIMQLYLEEKKIGYALIQGDTKNRQEELRRFEHDNSCMVFLGSLQAVGLGVELTAASIVIHYDRWWNPARENQATDRVYRMGQKRGVQVFKLVTKGTIEESIAKLIEKKAHLIEEIIGFDDEHLLKQITKEEWLEILELLSSS